MKKIVSILLAIFLVTACSKAKHEMFGVRDLLMYPDFQEGMVFEIDTEDKSYNYGDIVVVSYEQVYYISRVVGLEIPFK